MMEMVIENKLRGAMPLMLRLLISFKSQGSHHESELVIHPLAP